MRDSADAAAYDIMPFYSFENPQPEKVGALKEKIKGVGRIKPRLSVIWPLDAVRKEAFRELKEGEFNSAKIAEMVGSNDVAVQEIGNALNAAFLEERKHIAMGESGARREKKGEVKPFARWLFLSRKPLFATQYPEALKENLVTVERITAELRQKFGDAFVGVVLFGSTAKGYWTPESDLDFMVIGDDEEIFHEFEGKLMIEGIEPCSTCVYDFQLSETYRKRTSTERVRQSLTAVPQKKVFRFFGFASHEKGHRQNIFPRPRTARTESFESREFPEEDWEALLGIANLFNGIFFGDRREFSRIQLYVLEHLDPDKWDEVREEIISMQGGVWKAADRFGISRADTRKARAAALILRAPPAYDDALRYLRSRERERN